MDVVYQKSDVTSSLSCFTKYDCIVMQIATAAILKIEKLKYDISHGDAELVSQAYRQSAILNF